MPLKYQHLQKQTNLNARIKCLPSHIQMLIEEAFNPLSDDFLRNLYASSQVVLRNERLGAFRAGK
jgi:hypothetical protein